jgi:tetratricopeptide (TPR) repeat protein
MMAFSRTQYRSFLFALLVALCWSSSGVRAQQKGELPITTKSPEALEFYKKGLLDLRAYKFTSAQENWRKALELDPGFAMAHLHLAFVPVSPTDQIVQLQKAIASRNSVSPGEQKLLDWLANAMQGKMIAAVQSMNDALAMYPEDNSISWGAGLWLQSRGACDRAVPIYERILSRDKDFTPAWRGLGECHLRQQEFDKGFAAMKKYVALVPHEPVPEVYYGVALVRADRYDDGISHCQAALAMDANNLEAWRCVAMAHALKGDAKRARTEYAKVVSGPRATFALTGGLESAATWVQEKDFKEADKAFTEVANKAHEGGYGVYEAEAYRSMAVYQSDPAVAMDLLKKAEAALDDHQITRLDRFSKLASVLQTRAVLALQAQDIDAAEAASKQLQKMAETTHSPTVEHAASGAHGAILTVKREYKNAIEALDEDRDSPFSMKYLIMAWQKMGNEHAAKDAVRRLQRNNGLSVEQVVVLAEVHKQKLQMAAK